MWPERQGDHTNHLLLRVCLRKFLGLLVNDGEQLIYSLIEDVLQLSTRHTNAF